MSGGNDDDDVNVEDCAGESVCVWCMGAWLAG